MPAEIIARMRGRGHVLHAFGRYGDARLVEVLHWSWEQRFKREQQWWRWRQEEFFPGAGTGPDRGMGDLSAITVDVDRPPWVAAGVRSLGVNHLYAASPGTAEAEQFGSLCSEIESVASTGAGVIRQLGEADLVYATIVPSNGKPGTWTRADANLPIPGPSGMLAMLHGIDLGRDDGSFYRLSRSTTYFLACQYAGLACVPTLFARGGGSSWNEDADPKTPWGALRQAAADRRPGHQKSVIIPSDAGWDAWYWDGAPDATYEPWGQYALGVYVAGSDRDTTGYLASVAYRKRLGLLAFGAAIGEYLAFLGETGLDVAAVLPRFELGNEFNGLWNPNGAGRDAREASGKELGWFCTLLSLGVRSTAPATSFRFAELLNSTSDERWGEDVHWLRYALEGAGDALEVAREVRRCHVLESLHAGPALGEYIVLPDGTRIEKPFLCELGAEAEGWHDALQDDDEWGDTISTLARGTEPSAGPGDLVDQVGIHYYHFIYVGTPPSTAGMGYADQDWTYRRLAEFRDRVVEWARARDYPALTWTVSEIGFPADYLRGALPASETYVGATELLQAGMLLRTMLTALASGASLAGWHDHIELPADVNGAPQSWRAFDAMGLRNDVQPSAGTYSARAHAYRRPAWFAFQRLATLLSRTSSVSWLDLASPTAGAIVAAPSGSRLFGPEVAPELPCVIRLSLRSMPSAWLGPKGVAYDYAYVCWLDQFAAVATYTLTLSDPRELGFRRFRLAPRIDTSTLVTGEGGEYPAGEVENWSWPGWDATAVSQAGTTISIVLDRADPATNPLPLCILTSAELA